MKNNLIDYLACPKCGKPFIVKSKKICESEIIEGHLFCQNRHKFPINRGIPRFVTDKDMGFIKTEDAFSSKWKTFNKTYHQKNWLLHQQNWFLERFGWKTLNNFNQFLKTRTIILDAGTGIGNSAKLFSANPETQVFAIDASSVLILQVKNTVTLLIFILFKRILGNYRSKRRSLILFPLIRFFITQKIPKPHSNI